MKKIVLITIFLANFYNSKAQNNAHEIYIKDTSGTYYGLDFRIKNANLHNVNRITFYKYTAAQQEPLFIKEVYVSPSGNYYLVEDNQAFRLIQNTFSTYLKLYKDEYVQITDLKYKIFFTSGESQTYTINKPN